MTDALANPNLRVYPDDAYRGDHTAIAFELNGGGETQPSHRPVPEPRPRQGNPMRPGDTVHLQYPLRAFESRPAIVVEAGPDPRQRDDERVLLEFPTGERHWYPVAATSRHAPLDDLTIVVDALAQASWIVGRIYDLAWVIGDDLGDMVGTALESMDDIKRHCLSADLDDDSCPSPTIETRQ